MMQNEKTAADTSAGKPKASSGLGKIALNIVLFIILASTLMQLPTTTKIAVLVISGIGYFRPVFVRAFRLLKACIMLPYRVVKKFFTWVRCVFRECIDRKVKISTGVKRVSRLASAVFNMSGDEFESSFTAFTNAQPTEASDSKSQPSEVQQPAFSFIPESMCEKAMSAEQASQLAAAWWSTEDEGSTGEDRLAELLANIANTDPTKHTCVLDEHNELRPPVEVPVKLALVGILKSNGIAADFTPDEQIIVSWGQTSDGKEAGHI